MKPFINNCLAVAAAIAIAASVGFALKKGRDKQVTAINQAIHTAVTVGYVCRDKHIDLEQCKSVIWQDGTAPVRTFGETK